MAADKGLAKSGNRRGEASVHIQVTPQLSKEISLWATTLCRLWAWFQAVPQGVAHPVVVEACSQPSLVKLQPLLRPLRKLV